MRGLSARIVGIALMMISALAQARPALVGSKKFTESVILGEAGRLLVASTGAGVEHIRELGGTRVLWEALKAGDLDLYPEYTGTLMQEIFADEDLPDIPALRAALERQGLGLGEPFGFNNTYALGMRKAQAAELGITRVSDLLKHPDLRLGFGNEFLDRADGWPGLKAAYGLPHANVRGLDHDLAYRGVSAGTIDVTDLYTTDANIELYGLVALEDDRAFFPTYKAAWIYRADFAERHPEAMKTLARLEGQITAEQMTALNARSQLKGEPEQTVAASLLARVGVQAEVSVQSQWAQLAGWTLEHLALVGISLGGALLLALPLGIVAARRPRLGQVVLAGVGVLQTIPSLALLVVMIPLVGIGGPPAIAALFLYSLLPIVRNTHAGIVNIPPPLQTSALALGLDARARLWRIELPLAAPTILAGIKTAAVINVGTATLGALVGAGGLGQPILTGIRLADNGLILLGAVPAAGLALLVQGVFELLERRFVPKG